MVTVANCFEDMSCKDLNITDENLRSFLVDVVNTLQNELGNNLAAIILHGSLAMGTFYAPKSDVDLLVLVQDTSGEQARRLYDLFEQLHACRPYVGGLEVSVIKLADARSPKHPMPYLVHFSETTIRCQPWPDGVLPTDEDLIAHLTVARQHGRSLYGSQNMIGELPWPAYLASVRSDIDWILCDENILKSPYYGILNLCRWAMMAETPERIVPGKDEAGIWALSHLPEILRASVTQALAAYRSTDWPQTISDRQQSGGPWHRESLIRFRDYMRSHYGNEKHMS